MKEVYFITSGETASAPELVINGLKPHMTVKQVGANTAGKNVGSRTIRDWDSEGNVNPAHKWAMQPIVLKVANSQDFSDYTAGLSPVITASENPRSMLPFGDPDEVLLKACLNDIAGIKSAQLPAQPSLKPFKTADRLSRFAGTMVFDLPQVPDRELRLAR